MSNTNDTNANVTALPTEEQTTESVEKLSFVQKGVAFVKSHKKSTIAVGALVGLVGVAALTGRKDDDLPAFESLSPEEQAMTPAEAIEMYDLDVPDAN